MNRRNLGIARRGGKYPPHYVYYLRIDVGAFAKLQKATISFMSVCLYVRPHEKSRLELDGFSLNSIFMYFFEILSRKFKFH